jgi:arginyl-tRNA synthetase
VLDRAAEQKNPTYIVTYLLELAQEWSSYYAKNSILKAKTEDLKKVRLMLAQKVYEVLEAGLAILGIEIPEKM